MVTARSAIIAALGLASLQLAGCDKKPGEKAATGDNTPVAAATENSQSSGPAAAPAPAPPAAAQADLTAPDVKLVPLDFKFKGHDYSIDVPEGSVFKDGYDASIVKGTDFGIRIEFGRSKFLHEKTWWKGGGIYQPLRNLIDTDHALLVETKEQGPVRFDASAWVSVPYQDLTLISTKPGDIGASLSTRENCLLVLKCARTLKLKTPPPSNDPLEILAWVGADVIKSDDGKVTAIHYSSESTGQAIELAKKFPAITSLHLDGDVTGDAIAGLSALPNLDDLNVEATPSGPIIEAVSKLPRLVKVTLGLGLVAAEIDEESLGKLAALPNLQFLDICTTQAGDVALGQIKALHLKELHMGSWHSPDTDLDAKREAADYHSFFGPTDAGLKEIAGMTSLEILRFRHTAVNGTGLGSATSLPNLHEVYFEDSHISDEGLKFISVAPSLRTLRLGRTFVKGDGLKYLVGLKQLKELQLTGTDITDESLKQLAGLESLEILELNQTGITDAGLANLKGLKNLKRLEIGATQITDAGLANLLGLTNLERLHIGRTKVTDAGLLTLAKLKNLLTVVSFDTPITPDGKKAFETARDGA